jgi:hypothetical protein
MATVATPINHESERWWAHPVLGNRLGALGGLAFVVIVVAQNVGRFAIAPANGASAAEIIDSLAKHRALYEAMGGSLAVSGVALALFLGAAWNRLAAGEARPWAQLGFLGGAGIFAVFPLMIAAQFALLAVSRGSAPDAGAVTALWALHNGIFAVLDLSIAIATVGFSLAAVRAKLVPSPFAWLGPIAGLFLIVGVAAGAPITAGDAQPLMGLAGLGFIGWLALLVCCSVGMWREGDAT